MSPRPVRIPRSRDKAVIISSPTAHRKRASEEVEHPRSPRYLWVATVLVAVAWLFACASPPPTPTIPPATRRVVSVARDAVDRGAARAFYSARELGRASILSRRATVEACLRRTEQVMTELRQAAPRVEIDLEYDFHNLRLSAAAAEQATAELVARLPDLAAARPEMLQRAGDFLAAVDELIVSTEDGVEDQEVGDLIGRYARVVNAYNDWQRSVEALAADLNEDPIGLLR